MNENSGGPVGSQNNGSGQIIAKPKIEHTYNYTDKGPYVVIIESLGEIWDIFTPFLLGKNLKTMTLRTNLK